MKLLRRAVVLCLLLLLSSPSVADPPTAVEGLLDLSAWDFQKDGPIELRGEYEFYWGKFLNRRELLTQQPEYFSEVPKPWNGMLVGDEIIPGEGYATYRLTVLIPPALAASADNLAIKVHDFGTNGRVFIDGELMFQLGYPGTSARASEPEFGSGIIEFIPKGQRIEFVFHVSNYDHRIGGVWMPIILGDSEDIHRQTDLAIAKDLLFVGALLMIAIFNFAVFTLRPDKLSNLFLTLFCLVAGFRTLMTDDRFLLRLFELNWDVYSKLEYLAWFLMMPAIAHFLYSMFPKELDKKFLYSIDFISFSAFTLVLLTPLSIFSYSAPVLQIINAAAFFYCIYCLLLARHRRRTGANLLLFGFFFLTVCAINDMLVSSYIIDTPNLVELGMITFALCQSILASYDFALSITTVEKQYEQLATSNLKLQTQEKLRQEAELQSQKVAERFRESQQFEALGILAHGVVSDLKSSFSEAATEASALADALKDDPKLLASLEKTRLAANRSVAVIEDLLSISTFDGEIHATDINATIEEYLEAPTVEAQATKKKIQLEHILANSIQAVTGSRLHIQRILENLLNNAIESQPSGGNVTVSSEQIYTDGRSLFYDQIESGYYIIMSVEDKGRGIHPEDLDNVFQPFFSRGEGSRDGGGLGMSVVRAIVKQLGGGIDVISEMGQGTRFDIYLPVSVRPTEANA